jgi:hypothetical protein
MSDAAEFISREEVEAMVLAKVVEDPAFAARLKADPKAALSEMFETKLPANLNIHVFQETRTDLMIRLPIVMDDEISEKELEGVAGGACLFFAFQAFCAVAPAIVVATKYGKEKKGW